MAITADSISHTSPKVDKRKNRLGRFEIVIRDLVDATKVGRKITVTKVGTSWHARWRADGNLRMISSTEPLTSKRNAELAIAAEAGVFEVQQDIDKIWAVLVDGSRREIRVLDERDPGLAK